MQVVARRLARVSLAFAIAFEHPYAYLVALLAGTGMFGLLAWSGGLVNYYPSTGWDFYASVDELAAMLTIGALFGPLVVLQLAALRKARSAAGAAGGVLGTLFAMLGMSCCAPLLLPAFLSFVGFSGTMLLSVNVTLHELSLSLTVASIGFLVLAIGLLSRTITAACSPPRSTAGGTRSSDAARGLGSRGASDPAVRGAAESPST